MQTQPSPKPQEGTYPTVVDELRSRIRGDYSRWVLVELYSGRWAAIWHACVDNENYCSAIISEEFFDERNPSYLTAQDAVAAIVVKIEQEAAEAGEWLLDAHANDIRRAQQDIQRYRAEAITARHEADPVLAALADAWTEFCIVHAIPRSYDGEPTEAALEAIERAQDALRDYTASTESNALLSLLHLLGNASVRMEEVIDPIGFDRARTEIESSLAQADEPHAEVVPHEVAMSVVLDRARKARRTRG